MAGERCRTLRLDIASGVYENLEAHAIEQDIGVADLARRLIVRWSHDHQADSPTTDTDDV
jgi:hypothetical protein